MTVPDLEPLMPAVIDSTPLSHSSLPSSPRSSGPLAMTSHYVQALHDFFPADAPSDYAACLFFRRGTIIEVFNRDESGWWDGSSGNIRGWFPSNYVGRVGEAEIEYEPVWPSRVGGESTLSADALVQPLVGQDNIPSRVELAHALLEEDRRRRTQEGTMEEDIYPHTHLSAWESLLDDVAHQIADLVDACASQRHGSTQLAIFQVVSSIRAVLTVANTVSKDSPLLKSCPELLRQRKIVLSALSKLVLKGKELQAAPVLIDEHDAAMSQHQQVAALANYLLAEMDMFETVLRTSDHYLHRQISPRSSIISLRSVASSTNMSLRQQLVDTRIPTASLIAKAVPFADAQHILQNILDHQASIDELMAALQIATEKFLVSRHRATEMLEVTRKAVEAVRTFLAIAEHVCSSVGEFDYKHCSFIPEDPQLVAAVLSKETVYTAITNLVTAVRALLTPQEPSHSEDLDHLRTCCENVVRTSNACAASIRVCLQIDSPPSEDQQGDIQEMRERLENSIETRRHQTLSILGRKVTSLNVLQQQFQEESLLDKHADQDTLVEPWGETIPLGRAEEHTVKDLTVKDTTTEEGKDIATNRTAAKRLSDTASTDVSQERLSKFSGAPSSVSSDTPLRQSNASSIHRSSATSTMLDRSTSSLSESLAVVSTPDQSTDLVVQACGDDILSDQQCPQRTSSIANAQPTLMEVFPAPPVPHSKPPELKMLSSRSTPINEKSKFRRPRGMSVSSLRMSLRKHDDSRSARPTIAETLPAPSRLQRTTSWVEENNDMTLSERPENEEELTKIEPWFLKQRVFLEDEMMFNADSQVTGATVEALVEKLTLHEKSPDLVFTRAFFYNFRLFTTPQDFVTLLIERFNIEPPPALAEEETQLWTERVLLPVRLRVYNVLKTWLEIYFSYEQDACIEKTITEFAKGKMDEAMPALAKRMTDIISRTCANKGPATLGRKHSYTQEPRPGMPKSGSGSHLSLAAGSSLFSNLTIFEDHSESMLTEKPPPSIIARSLRNALRKAIQQNTLGAIPVNDFDALELARQLTVMESSLFCKILPNEMIGQEFRKKLGSSTAVHVKAMIQRSTQVTSWVSDSILSELDVKKRAQMIKFWIKVGDNCFQLNNYNTLMAIRSALDTTSVGRLKKTWELVPAKYRALCDPIYRATDSQRNFAEYRQRLKNSVAPCLPFLGVYLTDMTFIDDGNADHRVSAGGKQLINFDKYIKTTRVLNEIDQFQIPYRLLEVEEIQRYLQCCLDTVETDDHAFYTRSLKLEPREEEVDLKERNQ